MRSHASSHDDGLLEEAGAAETRAKAGPRRSARRRYSELRVAPFTLCWIGGAIAGAGKAKERGRRECGRLVDKVDRVRGRVGGWLLSSSPLTAGSTVYVRRSTRAIRHDHPLTSSCPSSPASASNRRNRRFGPNMFRPHPRCRRISLHASLRHVRVIQNGHPEGSRSPGMSAQP